MATEIDPDSANLSVAALRTDASADQNLTCPTLDATSCLTASRTSSHSASCPRDPAVGFHGGRNFQVRDSGGDGSISLYTGGRELEEHLSPGGSSTAEVAARLSDCSMQPTIATRHPVTSASFEEPDSEWLLSTLKAITKSVAAALRVFYPPSPAQYRAIASAPPSEPSGRATIAPSPPTPGDIASVSMRMVAFAAGDKDIYRELGALMDTMNLASCPLLRASVAKDLGWTVKEFNGNCSEAARIHYGCNIEIDVFDIIERPVQFLRQGERVPYLETLVTFIVVADKDCLDDCMLNLMSLLREGALIEELHRNLRAGHIRLQNSLGHSSSGDTRKVRTNFYHEPNGQSDSQREHIPVIFVPSDSVPTAPHWRSWPATVKVTQCPTSDRIPRVEAVFTPRPSITHNIVSAACLDKFGSDSWSIIKKRVPGNGHRVSLTLSHTDFVPASFTFEFEVSDHESCGVVLGSEALQEIDEGWLQAVGSIWAIRYSQRSKANNSAAAQTQQHVTSQDSRLASENQRRQSVKNARIGGATRPAGPVNVTGSAAMFRAPVSHVPRTQQQHVEHQRATPPSGSLGSRQNNNPPQRGTAPSGNPASQQQNNVPQQRAPPPSEIPPTQQRSNTQQRGIPFPGTPQVRQRSNTQRVPSEFLALPTQRHRHDLWGHHT